jgi:hypothetical protein
MAENTNPYYVYMYIDPRNHSVFYIGKGLGTRKLSHLGETSETEKSKVIRDIEKEGEEPIIRVVAKDLTEEQALLVEATLIWQLKPQLTNQVSGHFKSHFRPENTLHKNVADFDFSNDVALINCGEGDHRNWDDMVKYSYIGAGQASKYRDALLSVNVGDIVVAYKSGAGYVGIGVAKEKAVMIRDFEHNGKRITAEDLSSPNPFENSTDEDNSEYCIKVEWHKVKTPENAIPRSVIDFHSLQTKVSLSGRKKTMDLLQKSFEVSFDDLLKKVS